MRDKNFFIIGARPSPLSIKQVEEFVGLLNRNGISFNYKIQTFHTTGDRDKTTPIYKVEGSDFFTDVIQDALLNGEIDLAIHSAKDLPDKEPDGLTVVCVTHSIEKRDALVVSKFLRDKVFSIDDLPPGARIGTSSARRKEQVLRYRNDLELVDVRGNIEERLKKLDTGELDALIVAGCALIRLGIFDILGAHFLTERYFAPHPLQGCLAVEVRKTEEIWWKNFLKNLDSGLRPAIAVEV